VWLVPLAWLIHGIRDSYCQKPFAPEAHALLLGSGWPVPDAAQQLELRMQLLGKKSGVEAVE
jgi:hypothetical protein